MFPMAIGPFVPFDASGTNETVPYLIGCPLNVTLPWTRPKLRPLFDPHPDEAKAVAAAAASSPRAYHHRCLCMDIPSKLCPNFDSVRI